MKCLVYNKILKHLKENFYNQIQKIQFLIDLIKKDWTKLSVYIIEIETITFYLNCFARDLVDRNSLEDN